ncbi:uncharacterized protein E0L32_000357 [Thyridium curvatum]|uniref:Zn(2)-C6 fungal-type domain-containing protein n=1 Tax=Thyridium curvatum TaxID=1093900 RepID=A0A507B8L2_9PEZI|nr:uncharacterized protein E0L32_000357 [Thyridium curvatum]TPX16023.1 hypothetical protein E0L32_000357 [Thyridium curvatum]
MNSKHRSSEGCWTCRLRRKKCDEGRPVCAGCAALEIHCLYSDAKPEWMDNGDRQKERADKLKAEVKRRAAQRRERRYYQSIGNGTEDIEMITDSDGEQHVSARPALAASASASVSTSTSTSATHGRATSEASEARTSTTAAGFVTDDSGPESGYTLVTASEASFSGATPVSSNGGYHSGQTKPSPASTSVSQEKDTEWALPKASLAPPSLEREWDTSFIMMYLDYVFPFLYPFYRPTLLSNGRGWLLVLLMNSRALFHSSLSLTSFFFSMAMRSDTDAEHTHCQVAVGTELQKQQELSLRELHSAVQDINRRGIRGHLAESARVMASVIQLLVFEVTIAAGGTSNNWTMHLDAAIMLCDQLVRQNSTIDEPDPGPSWCQIMGQLSDHGSLVPHIAYKVPFNSDQSALRFYTAVLLHMDVVSSTALDRPPRLAKFHAHLLTETEPGCGDPRLRLDEFVGVENWVVLALGQISALAAWKRDMAAQRRLSLLELVGRAAPIERELRARLAYAAQQSAADLAAESLARTSLSAGPGFPFTPAAGLPQQRMPPVSSISRIWGQAALTYLLVVISGWQPQAADVRESVGQARSLLQEIPSPHCLRTVAWPLCVVGCLATREEEGAFRDLVAAVGRLDVYGLLREALAIMEAVWARRDEIEAQGGGGADWDFVKCFNVLGRKVLMV